ncbi:MAG: hypothetical protein WC574_03730 [Candidatus Omnitrophota bacterium]
MDKQTSDERLLKLIEGSGEQKHKQAGSPWTKRPLMPTKLGVPELKLMLKNLKIDVRSFNKGLIALCILFTFVFLYTLLSAPIVPKSNAAFFIPESSSAIVKLISSGQAQGLVRKSISAQDIRRNFFLPPGSKVSPSSAENKEQDLTEETKDFKLVGIIWSQNPEVMIENAKDSRTYILRKGDTFNEQFKVKDISRNSAMLEMATDEGPKQFEIR